LNDLLPIGGVVIIWNSILWRPVGKTTVLTDDSSEALVEYVNTTHCVRGIPRELFVTIVGKLLTRSKALVNFNKELEQYHDAIPTTIVLLENGELWYVCTSFTVSERATSMMSAPSDPRAAATVQGWSGQRTFYDGRE
jgi:hypothetical protein